MIRNGKGCVSCIILQNLRSVDYADSLSELFRTASHPGEMLSVRAFAQQIERIDLCREEYQEVLALEASSMLQGVVQTNLVSVVG
ncbi:hypothetical protein LR48_Vigan205s002200 [Vigna angularis]|uniref:Uncharacterized protein n=1 Tax=Phaseolus angularis TaxID=3914 RepID=A0A0L9T5K7_PHAAN|nr:hypothetical protein LR48_Vigan205s002200 [Vigna angularis]